ncbi:DF family (seleno)protein [Knoellia sp. LjRoot47]|uniref:DF family (seleno)protein n=1 Tax=Knoellia sp. LjRoot47 TaxID=3342330 RepID=UPI003ED070AE
MKIELLFFDGCPNSAVAEERLLTALRGAGLGHVDIERIKVTDPEHAERLGFTGSPTVRVNGRDPFATGDEKVGFACRVYTGPDGLSGAPSLEQFRKALA